MQTASAAAHTSVASPADHAQPSNLHATHKREADVEFSSTQQPIHGLHKSTQQPSAQAQKQSKEPAWTLDAHNSLSQVQQKLGGAAQHATRSSDKAQTPTQPLASSKSAAVQADALSTGNSSQVKATSLHADVRQAQARALKADVSQAKTSSLHSDELDLDELLKETPAAVTEPAQASTAIAEPVSQDQDDLEDWLNNL